MITNSDRRIYRESHPRSIGVHYVIRFAGFCNSRAVVFGFFSRFREETSEGTKWFVISMSEIAFSTRITFVYHREY